MNRLLTGMVVFDVRIALDARHSDGFERNRFRLLRRSRAGDIGPPGWWICASVGRRYQHRQIFLPSKVLVRVFGATITRFRARPDDDPAAGAY